MDNQTIKNLSMFIVLEARRWLKVYHIPTLNKLYMACRLDNDKLPIDRPWPVFTATSDHRAFVFASNEWPLHKHIVRINPDKTLHPRNAIKEI